MQLQKQKKGKLHTHGRSTYKVTKVWVKCSGTTGLWSNGRRLKEWTFISNGHFFGLLRFQNIGPSEQWHGTSCRHVALFLTMWTTEDMWGSQRATIQFLISQCEHRVEHSCWSGLNKLNRSSVRTFYCQEPNLYSFSRCCFHVIGLNFAFFSPKTLIWDLLYASPVVLNHKERLHGELAGLIEDSSRYFHLQRDQRGASASTKPHTPHPHAILLASQSGSNSSNYEPNATREF